MHFRAYEAPPPPDGASPFVVAVGAPVAADREARWLAIHRNP